MAAAAKIAILAAAAFFTAAFFSLVFDSSSLLRSPSLASFSTVCPDGRDQARPLACSVIQASQFDLGQIKTPPCLRSALSTAEHISSIFAATAHGWDVTIVAVGGAIVLVADVVPVKGERTRTWGYEPRERVRLNICNKLAFSTHGTAATASDSRAQGARLTL